MKIKTKDGARLHLQAPSKLTGDYDPDFEGTVDDSVAADMQVSRRGGVWPQWAGHAAIMVDRPVMVKGGRAFEERIIVSVVHIPVSHHFSNQFLR